MKIGLVSCGKGKLAGTHAARDLYTSTLFKESPIEGAGVYTTGASDSVREFVRSTRPIARMGTPDDVANAAEYLASDLAGFVSGQHLLLSGGAPA